MNDSIYIKEHFWTLQHISQPIKFLSAWRHVKIDAIQSQKVWGFRRALCSTAATGLCVLSVLLSWVTVPWAVVSPDAGTTDARPPRRPQVCPEIWLLWICGSHGLPDQELKSPASCSRHTGLCPRSSTLKPVENWETILRAHCIFSSTIRTGSFYTFV